MPFTLDYRPKTFSAVMGQDHIKTVLQQQIKVGAAKSNYLFFGPRGTGKTSLARIMAKALNCDNLQDGNPCNVCDACRLIDEGKTLDVVEIDAASHTGVDNIREEIIDKALYAPTTLRHKVYIIDEVHMLSKGAFNALLKIMEEPPAYMTFILATTEIYKIPETILSRCQTFQFYALTVEQIMGQLGWIAEQEKLTVEQDALKLIAQRAGGIMRDANKFLEQVSVLGDVTVVAVSQYLGVVGDEAIATFLDLIQQGDLPVVLSHLDGLGAQGVDLQQLVKQVLVYIDTYFVDDPAVYAPLVAVFMEIMRETKYAPTPLLAYKVALYEYMGREGGKSGKGTQKNSKKGLGKKILSQAQDDGRAGKTSKNTQDDVIDDKVGKDSQADEVVAETAVVSDVSLDQLQEQLFAGLGNKASLAGLMRKSASIRAVQGSRVEIVVINKMAQLSLEKDEHRQLVEQVLSDALGRAMGVDVVFMSKEEYMASL